MKGIYLACFGATACLCAVPSVAPSPPGCRAEEPAAGKRDVKELIAQLGSQSFEVREAATRRLKEREDAAAALREALKSGDPEVARRAREILDALARRAGERPFAAFADAAKRGAVDQAVERLVRRDRWDDEEACWKALAGLADKLTALERQRFDKVSLSGEHRGDDRELRRVQRHVRPKRAGDRHPSVGLWEGRFVLRAGEDFEAGIPTAGFLIAAAGNVEVPSITHSAVFAGGSVDVKGSIGNSLVVCDGDVTSRHIIKDSLIIARGKVRCDMVVENSRIISGGGVEWKHPELVKDSKVLEKEAKPLGFVTFFDPADAGITVESAEGEVRVKKVEKGKAFAAAGLRADDLVTALDGEAVKDAESFRRLLRAKLAVEGTTTFKVRRGDKAVEIPVAHKD
jgi:hypothetical protein